MKEVLEKENFYKHDWFEQKKRTLLLTTLLAARTKTSG